MKNPISILKLRDHFHSIVEVKLPGTSFMFISSMEILRKIVRELKFYNEEA